MTSRPPDNDGFLIDAICDEFESAWLAGQRPDLKQFLQRIAEGSRPQLFRELLVLELDYVQKQGAAGQPQDYLQEFGEFAGVIEELSAQTGELAAARGEDQGLLPGAEIAALLLPPDPAPASTFGDYELLEQIAQGGMGVVYKALDTRLNRIVAIKMIRDSSFASDEAVRRFQREAELAASFDHPGIVPIYEVGQLQGRSFFAMGYVDGPDLSQRIQQGPMASRQAAALVKSVAEAVHYAHQKGLVHRDLKPANILLAAGDGQAASSQETLTTKDRTLGRGSTIRRLPGASLHDGNSVVAQNWQPRITDFGLAKRMVADSELTTSGQILGTPSYMAPEQASSNAEVGPATDVYALGAILYATLTSRPPFQAADVIETVRQVQQQDPVPPRQLNSAIERDLETICLKCLEKVPSSRYATAIELADDLGRWLEDKPIQARPVTRGERAWRWCRRNPLLAGATALAVIGLLLTTGVAISFAVYQSWAKQRLLAEQAEKNRALVDRTLALNQAQAQNRRVSRQVAESYYDRGQQLCEKGQIAEGLHWLLRAASSAPEDSADLLDAVRWNLAQWMPRCIALAGRMQHGESIRCAAFAPRDDRIVAGGEDGVAVIWDWQSGERLRVAPDDQGSVNVVSFNPDGRLVATASSGGTVRIWNSRTGEPVSPPLEHPGQVVSLAFDPASQLLMTGAGDGTRLWSVPSGEMKAAALHDEGPVNVVAFHPQDAIALSANRAGTAQLWDTATAQPTLVRYENGVVLNTAAFSPDGTLIATGSDSRLAVWDLEDASVPRLSFGSLGRVRAVAWSPDGRRILAGNSRGICRLWSLDEGGEPRRFGLTYGFRVSSMAFSPDGKHFVAGDSRGAVKLWDTVSGSLIFQRSQSRPIAAVEFSRDGALLLIATDGGEVSVFDLSPRYAGGERFVGEGVVLAVAFGPDSKRLCLGVNVGYACIWDIATGLPVTPVMQNELDTSSIPIIAWSPVGDLVATGSFASVRVWNAETGRPQTPELKNGYPRDLQFSHDGSLVLSASNDLAARIWHARTGEPAAAPLRHAHEVSSARFSPDDTLVATASRDMTARVWDARTGSPVTEPLMHPAEVTSVAFHPDGKRILTGCSDQRARVWDIETGRCLLETLKHDGGVLAVAVSPDGKTALTGGQDDTARLWELASGRQRGAPLRHDNQVRSVAFSPDGTLALTGSQDQSARLWHVAANKPVGPPAVIARPVHRASFAPDASRFCVDQWPYPDDPEQLSGVLVREVRPPLQEPWQQTRSQIEAVTGMRLDETDTFRVLDIKQWSPLPRAIGEAGSSVALTDRPERTTARPEGALVQPTGWHSPIWNRTSRDDDWRTLDLTHVEAIEAAGGVVDDFFLFHQSMPLEECLHIMEPLAACSYRPIRLRPYTAGNQVLVAGIWTRDAKQGSVSIDPVSDSIHSELETRMKTQVALDICSFAQGTQLAVTWEMRDQLGLPQRLYFELADQAQRERRLLNFREGFDASAWSIRLTNKGQRRHAMIWTGIPGRHDTLILWSPKLYDLERIQRLKHTKLQVEASIFPGLPREGTHYLGIWYTASDFTSETLYGLDPATHLQQCRQLIAQGYRPVAIDAAEIGPDQILTTSCWHRPAVSSQEPSER